MHTHNSPHTHPSYLMFGTVTGILMATFLDITGGAWDNAKKYAELGNFRGKNSGVATRGDRTRRRKTRRIPKGFQYIYFLLRI